MGLKVFLPSKSKGLDGERSLSIHSVNYLLELSNKLIYKFKFTDKTKQPTKLSKNDKEQKRKHGNGSVDGG